MPHYFEIAIGLPVRGMKRTNAKERARRRILSDPHFLPSKTCGPKNPSRLPQKSVLFFYIENRSSLFAVENAFPSVIAPRTNHSGWPNRLQDGSYDFDGRHHQLPLNELYYLYSEGSRTWFKMPTR
jgi:hypothetical protein